jgi:potassium efflux system protein
LHVGGSLYLAIPMKMLARLTLLVTLAATPVAPATAQEPTPTVPPTADLTIEQVRAAAEAAGANTDLSDEEKTKLQETYAAATAQLERAAEAREKADAFRKAASEAPAATRDANDQLATLPDPEDKPDLLDGGESMLDSTGLRALLTSEENKLSVAEQSLANIEASLDLIETRQAAIPAEMAAAREGRSAANAALGNIDAAAGPIAQAERLKSQADLAAANANAAALDQETLSAPARTQVLKARRDLLERTTALGKARVDALRTLVKKQIEKVASDAASLAERATPAGQQPSAMAGEVETYSTDLQTVIADIADLDAETEALARRIDDLDSERELVLRHSEAVDDSGALSQLLLDLQYSLPDPRLEKRKLQELQKRLTDHRLARVQAENELRKTPAPSDNVAPAERKLIETKRRLLGELDEQYQQLIRKTTALEIQTNVYVTKLEEFRELLIENLFWVRSSPPLGIQSFADLPVATSWLLGAPRWTELRRALPDLWRSAGFPLAGVTAIALVLVALRRRLRKRMASHRMQRRRISSDHYGYTLEALAFTVLIALPAPLVAWTFGRSLLTVPDASEWLIGLSYGLQLSAPVLLVFLLLRETCHPDGIARIHFRWQPAALTRLRRGITALALVYVPAVLMLVHLYAGGHGLHLHSLAQLVLIILMLALAAANFYILRPESGVLAGYLKKHPNGALRHSRHIWFGLAILAPVCLAVLAGCGFAMTSLRLGSYLQDTAAITFATILGYYLLLKWFTIRERKMALERLLAERKARQEAASQTDADAAAGQEAGLPDCELEAMDMKEVETQTRRLLRALAVSAAVVALWFAWSDALPILRSLDTRPLIGPVTAADLLMSLVIIATTTIVARNLPGILEVALLRNLPMDSGSRYAASSLAQYVIVAIGLFALFRVLPLNWAQLGWILTALSVGLGFGLQEVVANFVCGIILLFERPIRVGDVVTVGNTTGTITRIRIRATTVTDWDRKELVVPNKEFITGQVLNWTLSSSINRIVINVGVSYATDIGRAREILLQILTEHPELSEDPAPSVTFESLGDSSLNLVGRCFLPDLERRLVTINDIHTTILTRFREEGIEIPFPQRDLHIRSGWGGGPGPGE